MSDTKSIFFNIDQTACVDKKKITLIPTTIK